MKKIKFIIAGLIAFVCITVKVQAQTTTNTPNYYAGQWDVLAKGIPGGAKHLFFTIAEKDGALAGTMQDPESKQETPLTKVEQNDKGVILYFTSQKDEGTGNRQKKDDDHVTGSMMGMFECTGDRVKQ